MFFGATACDVANFSAARQFFRVSLRIKFIWRASQVVNARWHLGWFGFYEHHKGFRDSGIVVSVRGTLAWAAAGAALAWVAGATAVHSIWQRNPYSQLTYTDALFYPLRRAQISEKQGQALIARGTDLWLGKKYLDAAALLRQGLAR